MTSGNVVHGGGNKFATRPSSMKVERIEHIAITTKHELVKKSKQDRRPVTCIEGNLSNAVRHMRLSVKFQSVESYAITNKL
jgi:hypothetical protein